MIRVGNFGPAISPSYPSGFEFGRPHKHRSHYHLSTRAEAAGHNKLKLQYLKNARSNPIPNEDQK